MTYELFHKYTFIFSLVTEYGINVLPILQMKNSVSETGVICLDHFNIRL